MNALEATVATPISNPIPATALAQLTMGSKGAKRRLKVEGSDGFRAALSQPAWDSTRPGAYPPANGIVSSAESPPPRAKPVFRRREHNTVHRRLHVPDLSAFSPRTGEQCLTLRFCAQDDWRLYAPPGVPSASHRWDPHQPPHISNFALRFFSRGRYTLWHHVSTPTARIPRYRSPV